MDQVAINTTQNVNINFNLASFGDRMLGYLIDEIIKFAYILTIALLLSYLDFTGDMDQWSIMAIYIVFFIPAIFYSLFLETMLEGQTIGKRIMKTKVVKIDGYQASFGDYLIRWVMRLVDIYSNSAIVGIMAIVSSKNSQRLGDMAAGTAVISLKNKYTIDSTILENIGEAYQPVYPLVVKLSDNDARIIKNSFMIASKKMDTETLRKLRVKIEEVTGSKNVSGNDIDFIKTVLKDYNFYTQNM
ncbi:MAG: RDD family protein [Chitinophagales bacterium]|jgi:uncharacterized RDD family membrane protein YckC|nr:RDD family protein [Sphingobacteriales bacterium]